MSEDKHTTGEWKFDGMEVIVELPEDECSRIATVYSDAGNRKENGQLIAAAPDLLEACEFALTVLRDLNPEGHATVQLVRAIVKAKGEE